MSRLCITPEALREYSEHIGATGPKRQGVPVFHGTGMVSLGGASPNTARSLWVKNAAEIRRQPPEFGLHAVSFALRPEAIIDVTRPISGFALQVESDPNEHYHSEYGPPAGPVETVELYNPYVTFLACDTSETCMLRVADQRNIELTPADTEAALIIGQAIFTILVARHRMNRLNLP